MSRTLYVLHTDTFKTVPNYYLDEGTAFASMVRFVLSHDFEHSAYVQTHDFERETDEGRFGVSYMFRPDVRTLQKYMTEQNYMEEQVMEDPSLVFGAIASYGSKQSAYEASIKC